MITVGAFSPPSGKWTVGDLTGAGVARAGGAGLHKGNATLIDVARDWAMGGEKVYMTLWANKGVALDTRLRPWLEMNVTDCLVTVREGIWKTRQVFVRGIQSRFGLRAIRIAESHVEAVVCGRRVLLASSGVAPSDFHEWFDVREDPGLAGCLRAWFEDLPVADEVGAAPAQMSLEEVLRGWNA